MKKATIEVMVDNPFLVNELILVGKHMNPKEINIVAWKESDR